MGEADTVEEGTLGTGKGLRGSAATKEPDIAMTGALGRHKQEGENDH
jgi:hypothetical protein